MDRSLTVAPPVVPAPALTATALALLLGLQPLSTDLYLPALPMLSQALGAPMSAAQLTMSGLILAFGIAQLVWGPVADRFGRRPVLLLGLGLYAVASVLCTAAPDIGMLIVGRMLQGASLAASVVCARAMVRDLYEPQQGAHVMSQALTGLGLIAVCSPPLGGLLAGWLGWRAALAAVATVGFGVLLFIGLLWPETLPSRNPRALHARPLLAAASQVLRNQTFLAWSGLAAATYGGLFTILAASSFVYIQVFRLSPGEYGLAMCGGSLSYLVGTVACRRLLVHHGLVGTVRRGAWLSLAGGVGCAALIAAGVESAWVVFGAQVVYGFGHGLHQPCAQVGAVGPFPKIAGLASALAGFLLALVAFLVGLWLGQAMDGTARPLAYGLAFWAVITALIAWTLVRRHGEVRVAAA